MPAAFPKPGAGAPPTLRHPGSRRAAGVGAKTAPHLPLLHQEPEDPQPKLKRPKQMPRGLKTQAPSEVEKRFCGAGGGSCEPPYPPPPSHGEAMVS